MTTTIVAVDRPSASSEDASEGVVGDELAGDDWDAAAEGSGTVVAPTWGYPHFA